MKHQLGTIRIFNAKYLQIPKAQVIVNLAPTFISARTPKTINSCNSSICFRSISRDTSINPNNLSLSPIKIQISTTNEQQNQITPDKSRKNPKVSPALVKSDAEGFVELISNAIGAIRTVRSLIVDDISGTTGSEEIGHVFPTGLAEGCGEVVEFTRGTDDGEVVEFVGDEAGDEAGESSEIFTLVGYF